MQVIIIILLLLAVFLVIFTLQNSTEITVHVLFWEIADVHLVLIILACILLGYSIASIYFYPRLWKIKKEFKNLTRFNKELKELLQLNHPKKVKQEESNPEGIEFDDDDYDDDNNSFFKD